MIQINSIAHKKSVMGGVMILDHACVTVVKLDTREGYRGSPGMRCDIAFGIVNADGSFEAFNHKSSAIPFSLATLDFSGFSRGSRYVPGNMPANPTGEYWMTELISWIEHELVASLWGLDRVGPGAIVIQQKRKVFEDIPTPPV